MHYSEFEEDQFRLGSSHFAARPAVLLAVKNSGCWMKPDRKNHSQITVYCTKCLSISTNHPRVHREERRCDRQTAYQTVLINHGNLLISYGSLYVQCSLCSLWFPYCFSYQGTVGLLLAGVRAYVHTLYTILWKYAPKIAAPNGAVVAGAAL